MSDDLIRRSSVKKVMEGFVFAHDDCRNWAEKMIDALPSVDAVHVIRCGECRYYSIEDGRHVGWCHVFDDYISAREYCSAGERNE